MRLNTLTEKQRLILIDALAALDPEEYTMEQNEDIRYLQTQLENGKGTE